ncbi:unnamed protein product [Symbiodinium sp. CCMP2592]|nr:unnamed protein product [Symbiodinium sp. CCMP2592]
MSSKVKVSASRFNHLEMLLGLEATPFKSKKAPTGTAMSRATSSLAGKGGCAEQGPDESIAVPEQLAAAAVAAIGGSGAEQGPDDSIAVPEQLAAAAVAAIGGSGAEQDPDDSSDSIAATSSERAGLR